MANIRIACSDCINKFKEIWQRDNPQMMPNGISVKLKFEFQKPNDKIFVEYIWVRIISSDAKTKTYISYIESDSVHIHICHNLKIEFTHDEIIETSFKYDLLNYVPTYIK